MQQGVATITGLVTVTISLSSSPVERFVQADTKYCTERTEIYVIIQLLLLHSGTVFCFRFLEYWLDDMVQLPYCWTAATSVALMLLPLLFSAAVRYRVQKNIMVWSLRES